jgi:hypothetical protein
MQALVGDSPLHHSLTRNTPFRKRRLRFATVSLQIDSQLAPRVHNFCTSKTTSSLIGSGKISTTPSRYTATSNLLSTMCNWARQRYGYCGHCRMNSKGGYERIKVRDCESYKETGVCDRRIYEASDEYIIMGHCGCRSA